MTTIQSFELNRIVSFFQRYKGTNYIKPEKAGKDKETMLKIFSEGRNARYKAIYFAKFISKEFTDLNFYKCSFWQRMNGKGNPYIVANHFWIQLKNPDWNDLPQSVSLSILPDNTIDIRVDIHQQDKRLNNQEFNKKVLDQQFHLLDIQLEEHFEFRIREEDYQTYRNDGINAILTKYKNCKIKPLVQVGTTISLCSDEDSNRVYDEILSSVHIVRDYYNYIMTFN